VANARGTYAIVLSLDKDTLIVVGKLITFSFPAGYYLYVGSALGGLLPRVSRHIRGGRKRHWHIDYLRQEAKVVEAWYLISGERLECSLYQAAAGMPQGRSLVAGFGSTGCGCHSHLVHFPSKPSFEAFRRQLGEEGLDLRRASPELEGFA
jgi:Uri superfamily endonuclease